MNRTTIPWNILILMGGWLLSGIVSMASAQDSLFYRHASTVQEGAQRGFADVVRSAGEYNLSTAQAAAIAEEARSRFLDNRLKATETYFQMRQANRQYRAAEQPSPLSTEQLFRIASETAPQPLSASDLDPLTGQITWPLVLEDEIYSGHRDRLDALFAARARHGGSRLIVEIQNVARDALAVLRANILDYPAPEYLKARKFLESLAYSARAPHL